MRGLFRLAIFFLFSLTLTHQAWPKEFHSDFRPWAEYEEAGWIVFNSINSHGSLSAKLEILENMPQDVQALVYYQYFVDEAPAYLHFGKYVNEGRVHLVHFNIVGESTWTRDVMPVPVVPFSPKAEDKPFGLVGARHILFFEPDQLLADFFNVPLRDHPYSFEGGNFLASATGDCFIIESYREIGMTNDFFKEFYGCQRVLRFPYERDIGHIDERVKVLSDNLALTDSPRYAKILRDHGYQVTMVPERAEDYQNYLNAVLINSVAFVPTFNDPEKDQRALHAYESSGLFKKVVTIPSKSLVDLGTGGIHCLTATYPRNYDSN